MRRLTFAILCITAVCAAQGKANETANETATLYRQVLNPTVDASKVAVTERIAFERDALRFELTDGRLVMTQPIAGHVTAAVFRGNGVLTVDPPTAIERQQLALFRGTPRLVVPFNEAVFRFADATRFVQALGNQVTFKAAQPPGFDSTLSERSRDIEDHGLADAARVLQALDSADPATNEFFYADLKTSDHHNWIQAIFDPLESEQVRVHALVQTAKTGLANFDDTWTQFSRREDLQAGIRPAQEHPELIQVDSYSIQTTVPNNLDMNATAVMNITALKPVGRGVFLALDSNLRMLAAQADGHPVEWVQPKDPKRYRDPRYRGDWVYFQLPQPLTQGQKLALQVQYHGKYIIERVGDGNYYCRAEGWYPTYPFGAPVHRSNYKLTFAVNKENSVIATGAKVKETVEGKQRISEWHSEVPLTLAGFALGIYKELDGDVALVNQSKVKLQVFANERPDDDMRAVSNLEDQMQPEGEHVVLMPGLSNLNTVAMSRQVSQEVGNAMRFMNFYFGDYPYSKLAVTTIAAEHGQGWPSLLYLGRMTFLDATQLHGLGVDANGQRLLADTFRAHETAHQWWGHVVSWSTPHDVWMSEGFANASALLYEEARFGRGRSSETLKEWRRDLLQTDRFGIIPEQAGPIWLGYRLESSVEPLAYQRVVYDKGGWVLYMLRQMMLNARPHDLDGAFIDMMHDFTHTYYNRSASTEDFKAIVEKHMLRSMDLDQNHTMDWFFNEYVYGTGVPRIQFSSNVSDAGNGKYNLTLKVHQEPGNWKTVLPVYLHMDQNRWVRGQIGITKADEEIHTVLPFRPSRVVANEFDDVLADVRQ